MLRHRSVETNGIRMHLAEAGGGDPVILCHGFPELWYSWRHQLPALAAAGWHAVAVDMRGYGDTTAPPHVDAYDVPTLAADLVGLLDALGEEQAVFVGHDWGAEIVWQLARLHPERVRAVAGLSVPFVPRAPAPPLEIVRRHLGEDFYIVWFQQPGPADAALSAHVRRTLTTGAVWDPAWARRTDPEPARPHRFLAEEDIAVYVAAFERSGFTGGLNYYRNMDRNWALLEPLGDARVTQPALFVAGTRDPVGRFMPPSVMDGWVTDLRDTVLIEGGGHWIQQDRPEEVSAALLAFLSGL